MLAKDSNFDEKLLELSSEMDTFEGYTHAHGLRIAAIADAIGKSFNLATHDRFFMQQAALIHDIGEVMMNRDYIKQNRELSTAERFDMQPYYARLGHTAAECPEAERYYAEAISLPMFPALTEAQQDRVVTALAEACAP